MKYIEVCHLGCKCKVNEDGDCFCQNSKGEWVHRDWHCNEDGYPAVTACGFRSNARTYYRSIQVHILVAIAFVPNPNGKKEVNHLDFDRKNPAASNLEWVTHAENIAYSSSAGRHARLYGEENPNHGNTKLREKYRSNRTYALEKQSRPGGRNGRAIKCKLILGEKDIGTFCCQRDAVKYLVKTGIVTENQCPEFVIKCLKTDKGYKGYTLIQDL